MADKPEKRDNDAEKIAALLQITLKIEDEAQVLEEKAKMPMEQEWFEEPTEVIKMGIGRKLEELTDKLATDIRQKKCSMSASKEGFEVSCRSDGSQFKIGKEIVPVARRNDPFFAGLMEQIDRNRGINNRDKIMRKIRNLPGIEEKDKVDIF